MFGSRPLFKYITLFLITVGVIAGVLYLGKSASILDGILKPVSIVSKVVADAEVKQTDGRTNFLVLGVDKRKSGNRVTSALTDTIMVISIDDKGEEIVMISIPRDLWVENYRNKINSVYVFSKDEEGNYHPEEVANEVETILGIPIHYYAVVGFDIFTDSIDAIGGVNIDVENEFDDYQYPIEGMENAPNESDRYLHVHFDEGVQLMNGEKALQYSRSRHSVNPIEAGDFARARRQQNMVYSLKETVLSSETLLNPNKINELYEAYKNNVETDLTLPELLLIYQNYKDVQLDNMEQIVLSNEGESSHLGSDSLEVPTREERDQFYNGLYVLVPISRTFDQVHALVRTVLFE